MEEVNNSSVMDELIKSNQEFNDSVDDSFSFTKLFGNDKLSGKIVNLLLITALSVGAFNGAMKVFEKFDAPSQYKTMVQEVTESYGDAQKITKDNIAELATSGEDNIYKSYDGEKLIITSRGSEFETGDIHKDKLSNDLLELNMLKLNDTYASRGDYSVVDKRAATDVFKLNFQDMNKPLKIEFIVMKDDVLGQISNLDTLYPVIHKHKDLFVFAHELNHLSNNQHTYEEMRNETDTNQTLNSIVGRESASDTFSSLVVIQSEDLNRSDSVELLTEIASFRSNMLQSIGDTDHMTSHTLLTLRNVIQENPDALGKLKKLDLQNLDELSVSLASNVVSALNNQDLNIENNNYVDKMTETFNAGYNMLNDQLGVEGSSVENIKGEFVQRLDKMTEYQNVREDILKNVNETKLSQNATPKNSDSTYKI